MIEELDDILEELADDLKVFENRSGARRLWKLGIRFRIERSLATEKALDRRCQCPIEDYRDLPEGGRCLVCGGHTK
jgi:hypothetical protein